MENALYGSFLPIPPESQFPIRQQTNEPRAGAVVCLKKKIRLNEGRKRWRLKVKNEGDRPIQVSNPFVIFAASSLSFSLSARLAP